MKILLTSLNAKFIHTSLSLYSLKAFSHEYKEDIKILEFTINNDLDHCLSSIVTENPDIIGFSTYIWNINETLSLISNLKKVLPNVKIILGGPEVSYNPQNYLEHTDFVVMGEGEKPFYDLLKYFDNKCSLEEINSISYKQENEVITCSNVDNLDLKDIPFPYDDIDNFQNKIIYYESSRGCPYSCSYCLSSSTNGVRFLSEERVKSDLDFFLKNAPKQVKFVDRTFNAKKSHAIMIWEHIINNDNGITNFHFEISADSISDDMIEVLKNARVGLIQFEVGVQSTNESTLKEIDRTIKTSKIFEVVKKVIALGNIHIHLDLIAGLPFENFNSFRKSFNDTYKINPDMLQLGFLKLLQGSKLRIDSEKYGIVYRDYAPYEVLKTDCISYLELETLKGVEHMVDLYYNSHKYEHTIKYCESLFVSPFDMYLELHNHLNKNSELLASVSKSYFRTLLYDVTKDDFLKELLRFDLYKNENLNNLPDELLNEKIVLERKCSEELYQDEEIFKEHYKNDITKKQIIRNTRIEKFDYDIIKFIESKKIVKEETIILFDYYNYLKPYKLNKEVLIYETKRES